MADLEMKQRQHRILARETTRRDTYGGDQFRLFSTAKTLAWLANLHWLPLDGMEAKVSLGSLPENLIAEVDDDNTMLVFMASCLSACLDCSCDLFEPQTNSILLGGEEATSQFESVSAVVSCISLWLSQLCVRSRVALHASTATTETQSVRLRKAAEELRRGIFGVVVSPVKKCVLCLTNSTLHGENADLALLSVLGLLRAVVGLVSTNAEAAAATPAAVPAGDTSSAHNAEQPPDDDLFGSMDDALFMDIDLNVAVDRGREDSNNRSPNDTVDQDVQAFKEIWIMLIDMIKRTKVSESTSRLPASIACTSPSFLFFI